MPSIQQRHRRTDRQTDRLTDGRTVYDNNTALHYVHRAVKNGFVVSTSSRLNAFHEGWFVFNSGTNREWQLLVKALTHGYKSRIWKIGLTGRRSNRTANVLLRGNSVAELTKAMYLPIFTPVTLHWDLQCKTF